MTDQIKVEDLPDWLEAPFKGKISSRFQIKRAALRDPKTEEDKALAVVWDPQHQVWASGPLVDWPQADLENTMNNLAGATFTKLYGRDGYVRVLAAQKVTPGALSSDAKHLLEQYRAIYDWGPEAPQSSAPGTP